MQSADVYERDGEQQQWEQCVLGRLQQIPQGWERSIQKRP